MSRYSNKLPVDANAADVGNPLAIVNKKVSTGLGRNICIFVLQGGAGEREV